MELSSSFDEQCRFGFVFDTESDHRLSRKIAVIGGESSGKSSLIQRFIREQYSSPKDTCSYNNLFLQSSHCSVKRHNTVINLEIVDTDGSIDEMSRSACIGVDGYLLCFSYASGLTLGNVSTIDKLLFECLGSPPRFNVPRVLVGTMCDINVSQRAVQTQMAQKLADQLQMPLIGCSAITGENIDEVFEALLTEMEKQDNYGEDSPLRPESPIVPNGCHMQ